MINPPTKPKNKERRSREFLSSGEIDKLIKSARDIGRYEHRDATMILIAFRHGFWLPTLRQNQMLRQDVFRWVSARTLE